MRISQLPPEIHVASLQQDGASLSGTPEVASPDTYALKSLEESDSGTRLMNSNERRWGIVTPYALSIFSEMLDVDNSVECGYIFGKGDILLCVRLIQESKPSDFKELLSKYYALGVLSRARCLDDELPWHLAVSKRTHAGLKAAMVERGNT